MIFLFVLAGEELAGDAGAGVHDVAEAGCGEGFGVGGGGWRRPGYGVCRRLLTAPFSDPCRSALPYYNPALVSTE